MVHAARACLSPASGFVFPEITAVIEFAMIVWLGKEDCASSGAQGPRLGQVTRLPWCARRALAGCAAVPDFQRTENTGNYPYKWIRVKGRSRIFPDGSRPAAGRVAASVLRQVVAAAEQTARVLGKTAACVGAWTPGGGTSMRRTSQSIPSWSVSEMMSGLRGFSCRVGLAWQNGSNFGKSMTLLWFESVPETCRLI